MNTWNERLAKAIAESDYTPNALARKIGVSAPTVAAWIGAGTIKPAEDLKAAYMLRACDLLGIRPKWLIQNEGPMRDPKSERISEQMAEVIAMLITLDHRGGIEREDVIEIVRRHLRQTFPERALFEKSKRLP